MDIKGPIKKYIAENLLFSQSGFPYDDNASFLQEGIIDSIGVMELTTFVSQTFKIDVPPGDITPDNFDSVEKLSNYIARRQTAKAA